MYYIVACKYENKTIRRSLLSLALSIPCLMHSCTHHVVVFCPQGLNLPQALGKEGQAVGHHIRRHWHRTVLLCCSRGLGIGDRCGGLAPGVRSGVEEAPKLAPEAATTAGGGADHTSARRGNTHSLALGILVVAVDVCLCAWVGGGDVAGGGGRGGSGGGHEGLSGLFIGDRGEQSVGGWRGRWVYIEIC